MTATLPLPCAAKLFRGVIAEKVRSKELIDRADGARVVADDPGDKVVPVLLLELLPQADATKTAASTSAAKARLLVTGKSFPPVQGPGHRTAVRGHAVPLLSPKR